MRQASDERPRIRARAYVDWYNLYYGCLKRSGDKWLDLRALIECILPTVLHASRGDPTRCHRLMLKYFTAPILEAFAKSSDSTACQWHYHADLQAHLPRDLEIIQGYYGASLRAPTDGSRGDRPLP